MAHPIVMPSVGMFTSEGSLTAWFKASGERVAEGEPVAEITTEKTTQELVAPASGIVHAVAEIGATLPIQGLIGYILAEGEAPPVAGVAVTEVARPVSGAAVTEGVPPVPAAAPPPAGDIRASPVARRLAAQHGVDLASLVGSGPGGRIVEADVQAAIHATPPAVSLRVLRTIPLTGVRRTIAERLRSSLATTAQVTLTREVDAEPLVQARAVLEGGLGQPPPFDALFLKLFALALREQPDLNATIDGDQILVFDEIHVGFAVAVPGGLLVPVVRNADKRPFAEVVDDVKRFTERALNNQLQVADVVDGTATITNLGAQHVDAFSPIINPPQSVILGIGRIVPRAVVHEGQLAIRRVCVLSLSFDHRVVDGVPAAQLLDAVATRMCDGLLLRTL